MLPFLFAAALNVTSPDAVSPNRRNIVTLSGTAVLANTKPGKYSITAHLPLSPDKSQVVVAAIPSVRITPAVLRLKESKGRRFVAHIPVASGYSGPLFLCIMSSEPPPQAKGIVLVPRSCYTRKVLAK